MCIIVSKKCNQKLPKTSVLKECWENNPDGAGFSYVSNNSVVVDKGYMTYRDFIKRYKKLCKRNNDFKGKALLIHFRIGTDLANSEANTHPFPVTSDNSLLKKTYQRAHLAMAHNGIIPKYSSHDTGMDLDLTDTMNFIKYCVKPLDKLNNGFLSHNQVRNLLKNTSQGKLAFLDRHENVTLIGDFVHHDGNDYSNHTYKELGGVWTYHNQGVYNTYQPTYEEVVIPNQTNQVDLIVPCDLCGESNHINDLIETLHGDICEECDNTLKYYNGD